MKYTNLYGLPDPIVRAVQADPYDKGDADYSATELLKPPQIVRLFSEHEDELTEDASDAVWKLLGSGVHTFLERAYSGPEEHSETRLFGEVDGKKISGAPDLREPGKILDYKVTSAYTIMRAEYDDWEAQLNIYDWLAWRNGHDDIEDLEIVTILRDWRKSQRWKDNYPQAAVVVIPMNRWTHAKQEQFIRGKIQEHTTEVPRQCTKEETWNGIRCKDWCPVSHICPQYNSKG